jgi:effector-binding domain-containing protein
MISEPRIETRDAQPYVGIRANVAMKDFQSVIDRTLGELWGWVAEHGLQQHAGPPVFRYLSIGADGVMDVEFCIPLSDPAPGDQRIRAGTLPDGRYATLVHTGPYDGLRDATAQLLQWGEQQGVKWQRDANGEWQARLETYVTDPSTEPDATKWETQLAILLAD